MVHLMLVSLDVLYKQHRHVAIKIESSWGTPRCDECLYTCLVKDRERLGFCPTVYKEILNLYVLHTSKYGSKYSVLTTKELNVNVDA